MPFALDAAVSGSNSNAFIDRAGANAYFEGRLFADAWSAAPDVDGGTREQALVMATSILDRMAWIGSVALRTQRLQWPRDYVLKPYDPAIYVPENALPPAPGVVPGLPEYWPNDAIPRPIQEATCELALELLRASSDPAGEDIARTILSETVGPISTSYAAAAERPRGLARYPEVWGLIKPYLQGSRQPKVTRG